LSEIAGTKIRIGAPRYVSRFHHAIQMAAAPAQKDEENEADQNTEDDPDVCALCSFDRFFHGL
jgi:hypothetical protein